MKFFGAKPKMWHFAQIDSGAPVSIVPKAMLSKSQLEALRPSSVVLSAYGGAPIVNLGEVSLDLEILGKNESDPRSEKIGNCIFLVTDTSSMPLIGTNIIFGSNSGRHVIDKDSESATIAGHEIRIFDKVASRYAMLSQLRVVTNDIVQVRCKADIIIKGGTEAVAEGFVPGLPKIGKFHFLSEKSKFGDLNIFGGLYTSSQSQSFPIIIHNPSGADIKLHKGQKLKKATFMDFSKIHFQPEVVGNVQKSSKMDRIRKIKSELVIGDLSSQGRATLDRILDEYADIFSLKGELPGMANLEPFNVILKDSVPVSAQSYRTSYSRRPILKDILDKNQENGLMSKNNSVWNSPTLLVPKKDGSMRLVCDFRAVNQKIESDHYMLPKISDLIVNLSKSAFFVQSDLAQGFHQVPISAQAREILTVGNEFGQYGWDRMPMGVKSAPAYFQRQMDTVFSGLSPSQFLCYIDDILSHGIDESSCLRNWGEALKKLKISGLKIAASKTCVGVRSVKFCGHEVSGGKLSISEDRVEAVNSIRRPVTRKMAQGLFGFFNYFRNFIQNFAFLAKPISDTFRVSQHFKWTDGAQSAFETLRAMIVNRTLGLSIPDVQNDHFVLETDASDTTMAACLFYCSVPQCSAHSSSCLKPVQFWSQNFTESQYKKFIREKELLAFRNALRKFEVFLRGRKFTWRTDNMSVKWANRLKTSKMALARILAEVAEYDYDIEIMKSSDIPVSDFLTRTAQVNAVEVSKLDLGRLQVEDEVLKLVHRFVSSDRWPNSPDCPVLAAYKRIRSFLAIDEYNRLIFTKNGKIRFLAPVIHQYELMEAYHDKSGHPGVDNTLHLMKSSYFWPEMRNTVSEYIRTCDTCQRSRHNLRPRRPLMKVTDTPSGPYDKISCDLTGPFQVTENGKKYILVANDHFSKKMSARALESKNAFEVLREFKQIMTSNPWLPKVVLTDNGGEFGGDFHQYLVSKGIEHVRSAPYHPQSNGQTERSNMTLKSRLRPDVNDNWDELLPEVVQLINQCPNEVTRFSPFFIENFTSGQNPHDPKIEHDSRSACPDSRGDVWDVVKDRIVREKESRALKYGNPFFRPFDLGTRIMYRTHSKPDKYAGPAKILKSFAGGCSYLLDDGGKELVRRAEELKEYFSRQNIENVENSNNYDLDDSDAPVAPVGKQLDSRRLRRLGLIGERAESENFENSLFSVSGPDSSNSDSSSVSSDSTAESVVSAAVNIQHDVHTRFDSPPEPNHEESEVDQNLSNSDFSQISNDSVFHDNSPSPVAEPPIIEEEDDPMDSSDHFSQSSDVVVRLIEYRTSILKYLKLSDGDLVFFPIFGFVGIIEDIALRISLVTPQTLSTVSWP